MLSYLDSINVDTKIGKWHYPQIVFLLFRKAVAFWYTKFVGRSFLAKNKGDFKGAFQECHTLQNEYQPQCIAQVARLFIPPLLAFNPQQMIAACDAAGEDYKGMCLSAVAQRVDVEHKSYHAPLQKNDFCKLVEKRFQQECVSPIMNYSLLEEILRYSRGRKSHRNAHDEPRWHYCAQCSNN